MPAQKKYLSSPSQRFAKITAGLIGGYMVTVSLHLALAHWFNHVDVIMTLRFGGFILWVGLLIVAFLVKNGWKIWGLYLLITLVFSVIFYFSNTYHPILP
ncbi:MAG: hypothetical protein RIG62_09820 [Cyclobacteriaceae bacterium]